MSEIEGTVYYGEIEYLESTGTQWIDTGFKATNGCIMECDLAVTVKPASGAYYNVFGSESLTDVNYYNRNSFIVYENNTICLEKTSQIGTVSFSITLNQKYNIYCDTRNTLRILRVDGSTLINGTAPTLAPDSNVNIFCSRNSYYFNGRVYSFKMYDSNRTLVRDMIPVRVGQVGYMYDKVSCQLFGNSGTGDFVLGPDVSIPYGAEVEYLEDTGSQGIDTGIIPNASTKVQFKLMRLDDSANSVFGCGNDDLNDWRFFFYSNKAYFDTYGGTSGWGKRIISSTSYTINNIYSFEIGNYYIKDLDTGNIVASSDTYSGSNAQNIFLYGGFKIRLYYIKIYDGTTLVRDFIPVRVGQVGYMYDKVSGKLFSNSGTGSFIIGPYKDYLPLTGGTLTGQVTATKFVKSDSSDSYVLLGGGGHKLLSEFLLFPPLTGHAERFRFKATNFAWFSTGSVKVPFLVRGGVQEEIFFPVFSSFGIIHIHAGNYTVGMQGWDWWCFGNGDGVSVNYNTNGGYLHISISKSGSGWNVYYYVPFVVYANGLNYQGTATLEDQYTNSGMFALD